MSTEPTVSGREAIRLRVWSRWKKANLARTASDLSISLQQLEAFATSTGELTEAQLHLLTREFFTNAKFDAATDRLVNTNLPVKTAKLIPEPYQHPDPAVRAAQDALTAALAAAAAQAPTRKQPLPPVRGNQQPVSLKRAGFA